jgi:hypothetical protein
MFVNRLVGTLAGATEALRLLQKELIFKPLPEVRGVTLIAGHHKGSLFVCELIRIIASIFASPDDCTQQTYSSLLAAKGLHVFYLAFRAGLPMSIDQLVWDHPRLLAIGALPIDPSTERYSILSDWRSPSRPDGSNGQVPHASSRLAYTTSELLVGGGHYCLVNPDLAGDIAHILKEHTVDRDCSRVFRMQTNDPERCKKPRPQPKAGWNCSNSRDRAGASMLAVDVHASSLK